MKLTYDQNELFEEILFERGYKRNGHPFHGHGDFEFYRNLIKTERSALCVCIRFYDSSRYANLIPFKDKFHLGFEVTIMVNDNTNPTELKLPFYGDEDKSIFCDYDPNAEQGYWYTEREVSKTEINRLLDSYEDTAYKFKEFYDARLKDTVMNGNFRDK